MHNQSSLSQLAEAVVASQPVTREPERLVVPASSSILSKIKQQAAAAKQVTDPRQGDSIATLRSLLKITKPHKTEFVRTLITDAYPVTEGLLMLDGAKDGGKSGLYWLDPSVEFPDEIVSQACPVDLVVAANHNGDFFLWAIKQGDGEWRNSAIEAVFACQQDWHRIEWHGSMYQTFRPTIRPKDVAWEKLASYESTIETSVRAIAITDPNHIEIRRRLGETVDPTARQSVWKQRFLNA